MVTIGQGAEMAFTYQGEGLERRVRPLAESIGVKTLVSADVTDDASMDAAFAQIGQAFGPLDFSALKEDSSMEGVAGCALWLLSDLGRSTTGEIVHVDAGFHMMGMSESEEG